MRRRGYNQVSGFGSAIALKLGKPYYENILLKKQPTASQVFKSRLKRYQGDKSFYVKQPVIIKDAHVLLVDDLITSGATIENCAVKLFEAGISKLSIATMARA
jgi:predicted amidophosphoribosyltransferase